MSDSGIFMRKAVPSKRAVRARDEMNRLETDITTARGQLDELKSVCKEIEGRLDDLVKRHELERKKELSERLDSYR